LDSDNDSIFDNVEYDGKAILMLANGTGDVKISNPNCQINTGGDGILHAMEH
jgi:hypothetical protein